MKLILKKIYHSLPFKTQQKIQYFLYKRIDESALVYNIIKNKKGIMIDVGAHFGESLLPFAKKGWTVLAFEPDPKNGEILSKNTSIFNNITIDKRAVSDQEDQELPFYVSPESTGISSLVKFRDSHEISHTTRTTSLKQIVKEFSLKSIDFLKIDVEGHDLNVLKGVEWDSEVIPEVIVCEFEDSKTVKNGYTTRDLITFLVEKNYHIIISEWHPIIKYGGNHKWNRFLNHNEIEKLDGKSWGNLIACRNDSQYKSLFMKIYK